MNKLPYFSIIIPVRVVTPYLKETLNALKKQTYKKFEVIVVDDQISGIVSPAIKRNLGASKAKGNYLSFIDDDSYPDPLWLENISNQITNHPDYAGFCGPCLTPKSDNVYQQASGLVWSSVLGSGGAGTYRNSISSPRKVDDFPSVNLTIKKTDFTLVKGFNTHHWPGEDTILCLDITKKLKKTIYYHPSIVVYHHRRQVIIPHLQQITRYGLHRGNFARIYPQTSFRIGYLIPSLFLIYIITTPFYHPPFYLFPLYLYFVLLAVTFLKFIINSKILLASLLAVVAIPFTHLYYGLLFIIGLVTPELLFKPHQLRGDKYHGG